MVVSITAEACSFKLMSKEVKKLGRGLEADINVSMVMSIRIEEQLLSEELGLKCRR